MGVLFMILCKKTVNYIKKTVNYIKMKPASSVNETGFAIG